MPHTVARTAPEVPLAPESVFDQLCHIEKVFRLNPHWTVQRFAVSPVRKLQPGSVIEAELVDYATSETYRLRGTCTSFEAPKRLTLEYRESSKRETKFCVSEADTGSRITVEEVYGDEENEKRLQWHRNQLDFWLRSIIAYLKLQAAAGIKARVTRWFMDRFWIPATPSGRRISIIVFKLSLVELVLIVAIIVGWALFSLQ